MNQTVKFEKRGDIGIATICRPEALNALNEAVIDELGELVTMLENDTETRALIITGEGRAFVAGADIVYQAGLNMDTARAFGRKGCHIFRRLELLDIPTIAAVNGFALGGGCELALSCDVIIASEKAKFGLPEVSLGITPGYGGTTKLLNRVGLGKAKELSMSGKMIGAAEAKEIKLANEVVAPEELMDKAVEMAQSFMKNGPIAVKYAKAQINKALRMDIDSAYDMDIEYYVACFATEDQKEGMKAFMEKRPAAFQNR